MKTIFSVVILLILAASATAQSVADAARKARAQQHPSTATIRLDGDSTARLATNSIGTGEPDKAKDADSATKAADAKPADAKAADSKDQAKAPSKPTADDWTKKIEEQKKEISTLQRELDILQREQRLRAAAFYADAGTQLRDSAKFAEDSRKEQADIDAKKQALTEAQQKLEDLQEAARKAGSPTS
jgi:hypothetical protein